MDAHIDPGLRECDSGCHCRIMRVAREPDTRSAALYQIFKDRPALRFMDPWIANVSAWIRLDAAQNATPLQRGLESFRRRFSEISENPIPENHAIL